MPTKPLTQVSRQLAHAVLLLCFTQGAIAQQPPSDTASRRQPVAEAAKPDTAASSGTEAVQQAAQPPAVLTAPDSASTTSCPSCLESQQGLQQTLARLEAAASAAQAAASAASKRDDSFWGSVFVNVFSSRLDSLLFGSGEGGRGVIPVVAGALSLLAAAMKLMLAYSSLGKRQGERSTAVKRLDVGLAAFLTLTTALALWALMSAKSVADAATAPTQALTSALESCTSQLTAGRPSVPTGPAPDQSLVKALGDIRASCVSSAASQSAELKEIKSIAVAVAGDQHGILFNLLLTLSAMGVIALVWKAFFTNE